MEVEISINQNPWLKSENEIEYDEDIRKWKEGKRSWIPSIINEISIKPFFFEFYFWTQTSWKNNTFKLLIRKLLLEDKVEKERIFILDVINWKITRNWMKF